MNNSIDLFNAYIINACFMGPFGTLGTWTYSQRYTASGGHVLL